MGKEKAKKRIEELRKTVEYHANKYYNEDKPEISDFEYDMLMVELRNLEKQYPEFIYQNDNKYIIALLKSVINSTKILDKYGGKGNDTNINKQVQN